MQHNIILSDHPNNSILKGSEDRVQHLELLGFWLCPSSGILETRKQGFSETESVSVFWWGEDTYSVGFFRKS
jgi:hypothetical protein